MKSEIIVIADRSGSMGSIIGEARGSINTLIGEQKEVEGEANFTFVMFDDHYDCLIDRKDIQKVESIEAKDYFARGMTALYDSIGKTINSVNVKQESMTDEEKPDLTMVAIVTDGMENASKEFTQPQIAKMIKDQQKNGWKFVFFGANIDAFATGNGLNIAPEDIIQYEATERGVQDSYTKMSNYFVANRTSATYSSINSTSSEK